MILHVRALNFIGVSYFIVITVQYLRISVNYPGHFLLLSATPHEAKNRKSVGSHSNSWPTAIYFLSNGVY